MDTKKDSAASEVPTFKVARVGQERKRKGGAFSFLRGGSAPRGVWQGAAGGSGAGGAGAVGMTFSKIMTILVVTSVVGSGAIYTGSRSAAKTRIAGAPAKPAVFAQDKVKLEGDTSHLPSTPNTIPNSMGFITGSRDGLTPEERAKKEADAAAAAEAQRIADEEAAKKAEAEQTADNPAVDPNALLASAQADGGKGKGGGFGKKFGSLSSSMGGGSSLSGGAGMSGGVNRQFGGGGGMGGIKKGAGGSIAAMKASSRPTYSKSGNSRLAASRTKGFARKQLANANAYSRRGATAGKGESSASDAGAAFDNNTGAGNAIEGPGIGAGTKPGSGSDTSVNPNNGGPTGGGGPSQVDCGPDRYQNADGGCSDIDTNGGKDANPALTMMANIVMGLLLVIGVIAAIAVFAEKVPAYGTLVANALKTAIFAMSAIVALLGVSMLAMGDYVTGGLATLIGGIMAVMTYGNTATLTQGQAMVGGFGGAALTMVGKMLGGSGGKDKAPVAAQQ